MIRDKKRCKWCRGHHYTHLCPNPRGKKQVVKQFGTVVDGRYVPPPGVKVRVIHIPPTVHSEQLTKILKGLEATDAEIHVLPRTDPGSLACAPDLPVHEVRVGLPDQARQD